MKRRLFWKPRRRSPAPAIECKQVTRVAHLVSLRGELGAEEATRLELRIAAIVDSGGSEIVVDLADALSVDRSVVDVLLKTAGELRPFGGELLLAASDEHGDGYILKTLEPNAPRDLRGVHPGLDRALDSFSDQASTETVAMTRAVAGLPERPHPA